MQHIAECVDQDQAPGPRTCLGLALSKSRLIPGAEMIDSPTASWPGLSRPSPPARSLRKMQSQSAKSDEDSRVKPGYDGGWQRVQYVNTKGGWYYLSKAALSAVRRRSSWTAAPHPPFCRRQLRNGAEPFDHRTCDVCSGLPPEPVSPASASPLLFARNGHVRCHPMAHVDPPTPSNHHRRGEAMRDWQIILGQAA